MIKKITINAVHHRTNKIAGWGVVLNAGSDDGQVIKKVIARRLPLYTNRQVELMSVINSLACVKPEYYDIPTLLLTDSQSNVVAMAKLSSGKWRVNPPQNSGLIATMREAMAKFRDIAIEYGKEQEFKDHAAGIKKEIEKIND